jgi:hypothetical protein
VVVKFAAALGLLAAVCLGAGGEAADYARELSEAGLDPDACYHVRDIAFQKDDLRFYLNEGQLIFAKPVAGRRFAAVFTSDVPGGDAEVLLFPPHRSERLSLATFAKTPNLNEHFSAAVFLWTDGTGDELLKKVQELGKPLPEVGAALQSTLAELLRNMVRSYEVRLVQDRFSGTTETGFFYGALSGRTLGNFDVLFDGRGREGILVGQLVYRDNRQFFDVWTSFPPRRYRTGARQRPGPEISLKDVRIEATLEPPELAMKAVTRTRFTANRAVRALGFELSRRMKVTEARLDGVPVEVFTRDSLRANIARGENELVLIVAPQVLEPGKVYTLEFSHEGSVVTAAGNGVYFVGARTSWYPNRDAEFAPYELVFHHPRSLQLVATGEIASESVEGETRTVVHRTSSPIRFAGFNLGDYRSITGTRAGITVEVLANRRIEAALVPRPREVVVVPQSPFPTRPGQARRSEIMTIPMTPPAPDPASRQREIRDELGNALEFMTATFGPPPLKTLTVSPIPGVFGQGFPGLIYLSTLAYLNPADRPAGWRSESSQLFFSELLHAHEAAHQWWGNLVTSGSYQDDWLMEALANYTSLLVLEKRKGRRAMESVLESYRDNLLAEVDGHAVESAGPIVWGSRLFSSRNPSAWRIITYEKGSWILHMLRARLGDAAFLKMLGELVRGKRFQAVSTDEFRQLAAAHLPKGSADAQLEMFFDQWVYGTGIPSLRVNHKVTGKAPKLRITGRIQQSQAGEEFAALVPVEVQLPGRRTVTRWVHVNGDEGHFAIDVAQRPVRVTINPGFAVLAR